jgi:RimJ/RimL family protein N-acetyltransferase
MDHPHPTTPPTLSDGVVTIRSIRERDIQDRVRLDRDAEFARMLGNSLQQFLPFTQEDAERWYLRVLQNPYYWVIDVDDGCIGYACFQSVNEYERKAHYSIGIYTEAFRGRGIGTRVTHLILAYAFTILKLHRVDLRVLAINQRAIAAYRTCGFVQEGIERESAWIDGHWHNDLIMSILEHEYFGPP